MTTYITFLENSTKNDNILALQLSSPLVSISLFLKSSILLFKLLLTLKYMLSTFSCSQNWD